MDVLKDEPHTHELLLNERVMQEITAAHLIDKLRMRGTPIDMIDSYLFAGEVDAAGLAFRSVILETVYEHLRLNKYLNVQFASKQSPPIFCPKDSNLNLAFPFSEACVQNYIYDSVGMTQPPIYQITSTQSNRNVNDTLRATVLLHVANATADLLERIRRILNAPGAMYVRLYPSWSTGTLHVVPTEGELPIQSIGSQVTIGISAYQLTKKEVDPQDEKS